MTRHQSRALLTRATSMECHPMKRSWILSLSLGTLAGCATLAGPLGSTADGPVTLRLQPTVQDGGLRTQALVRAWTRSDIEHVVVRLKRVDGGSEADVLVAGSPVMVDVASRSLSAPIVLNGLKRNTTYRVRASAYKAPGEAAENLISEGDGSKATVTVGVDDAPAIAALPIKLKDQVFSAQATTSFDIVAGKVTYEGNPAATFEEAPPLGPFVTLADTLPYGMTSASPLKVGNKLYLFGGYQMISTNSGMMTNKIAVANLDSQGNPEHFTTSTTSLAIQAYMPWAIQIGNYVYVFSRNAGDPVQRAPINLDGSLSGSFQTLSTTTTRQVGAFIQTDKYIYLAGGGTNTSISQGFERAEINPDGTLGAFTPYGGAGATYEPGYWPSAFKYNNRFYVMGGGQNNPGVTFGTDSSGDITDLRSTAVFPYTAYSPQYALLAEYLYIFSGSGYALSVKRGSEGLFLDKFSNLGKHPGHNGNSSEVYFQTPSYMYSVGGSGNPSAIQRAPIN
jgi:hypothetical protein